MQVRTRLVLVCLALIALARGSVGAACRCARRRTRGPSLAKAQACADLVGQ